MTELKDSVLKENETVEVENVSVENSKEFAIHIVDICKVK